MQHTPGPWTYSVIGPRPIVHCGTKQDGRTCNNWESMLTRVSQCEETANALLIAAAPDLLEALEVLNNAIKNCPEYLDPIRKGQGFDIEVIDGIGMANQAIKKAKGL